MKARIIRYERLYNLGNFEHEKIAIEIEIEEGETASEVLRRAQDFCRLKSEDFARKIEHARACVHDPQYLRFKETVDEAQKQIDAFEYDSNNIPF